MTEDITLREKVSPTQRSGTVDTPDASPPYDIVTHNPFGHEQGTTSYFFEGANRAEQLDEAIHLTQFGNNIALISGDTGIGKTFFLEQACFELSETASCCFINGSAELSSEAIAKEIATELSMPFATRQTVEQLIDMLEDADVLQDISRFIIIVDDIHLLTEDIIFSLMQLSQMPGSVFHLLASGLPSAFDYLQGLQFQEGFIKEIYLLPYNLEETLEYLDFKMKSAGYKGENFFEGDTLTEIYKSSAGYPQKINKVAEYFLLSHDQDLMDEAVDTPASGFPLWHMVGAVFLLFLLILAFFYSGNNSDTTEEKILSNPIDTDQSVSETDLPNRPEETTSPTNSLIESEPTIAETTTTETLATNNEIEQANIPEENPVVNTEEPSADNKVSSAGNNVPSADNKVLSEIAEEPAVAAIEQVEPATANTSPSPASTIESAQAPAEQTSPLPNNTQSEPQAPTSATPSVAVPSNNYSADEQAVLDWPEGHSTIQVIGALDKASLEQYVAAQANKEILRLVTILRDGKPWHIVLANHYPDNNQAREAIQKLPQNQVNAGPWVRKVVDLKQGIRDFPR